MTEQKTDYLIAVLDYHLERGTAPAQAMERAVEDYAAVFHPRPGGDDRLPIARAAERVLIWEAWEKQKQEPTR